MELLDAFAGLDDPGHGKVGDAQAAVGLGDDRRVRPPRRGSTIRTAARTPTASRGRAPHAGSRRPSGARSASRPSTTCLPRPARGRRRNHRASPELGTCLTRVGVWWGRRRGVATDRPPSPTTGIRTAPVSATRIGRGVPNPSSASPAGSQRGADSSPSGGSVTTSSPSRRRKPTAHSAVTAGGPNDRATTRSNPPRRRSSRASASARPHSTATREARSRVATARVKKSHRRRWASSSTPVASDHSPNNTRPGTPPPLPRSRTRPRQSPIPRARSSACWYWRATGPGPSRPSSRRFLEDVEQRPRILVGHRDRLGADSGGRVRPGAGPRAGAGPRPPTRW